MVQEALWTGKLCGQQLLSVHTAWVLLAELFRRISNNLTLGGIESSEVILVFGYGTFHRIRPECNKLSSELFHFKIELYFFNL